MEYANLGRTGLKVSRLCLGTMNFGPHADEESSHQIMDFAMDQGINFFDTANVYGWELGEGITEQIIGHWIGKGGGRREPVEGSLDEPVQRRANLVDPRRSGTESVRPPRLEGERLAHEGQGARREVRYLLPALAAAGRTHDPPSAG